MITRYIHTFSSITYMTGRIQNVIFDRYGSIAIYSEFINNVFVLNSSIGLSIRLYQKVNTVVEFPSTLNKQKRKKELIQFLVINKDYVL